ncbi:acetolactate synthase-1/2/3 large subunit [Butyrivibrio sp. ob235]|uniref:thiamine pyrophosphate-binding protein n=1 Tax=Butyrivibrio sp. ob235 TaxID=1761780 RepID=UPI0008D29CDF|nr:thiamine pyrophosphate-binding protein [Butyrivibrio sp. ob235]SEM24811.1 acetolactate synthase-1/2/3 large subunit [Butyrivibrio sp. ob235]
MRVADYVMQELEKREVKHIFMLSGGGIMYLVDALGRSKIKHVCCHHEQAAAIAAVGYGMYDDSLGVCLVTTGPGGTNALTAAGAAFVDSTPVLFLSGQVKTADFASLRGVRQFGAQENDIVSMAKPVTKYAVTVMDKNDIRYEIEKALYLATSGRKGPVWLDIPLDIQNADIEPECIRGFELPQTESSMVSDTEVDDFVKEVMQDLKEAKRPLFILGHGCTSKESRELFLKINEKLRIPVVTTWRALDVMGNSDPLFFGSPGLQARRYSNIITQGADLVIILGTRLDNMITAFSEKHFAFRAKKYIIDIDENEMRKLDMPDKNMLVSSTEQFLKALEKHISDLDIPDYKRWISFCSNIKERFPLQNEKQPKENSGVDLYKLTLSLSDRCTEKDTIVVSSTSRCNTAGHMAFNHKKNQRTISSMGFGSMGFALPSAVGAYFASNCNRVIMVEGDGSLQLNLQEFQTIVHHKINAKMFIFHNEGYAAISTMQDRNFDGFHVGCDEESGVSMPDLSRIADAYGIHYYLIRSNSEIETVLDSVMNEDGPVICEFIGSILFDEIPKCISSLDENGKRVSAALENPYPFIDEDELDNIYSEIL